jgi:hypothetical protein
MNGAARQKARFAVCTRLCRSAAAISPRMSSADEPCAILGADTFHLRYPTPSGFCIKDLLQMAHGSWFDMKRAVSESRMEPGFSDGCAGEDVTSRAQRVRGELTSVQSSSAALERADS